MAAAMIDEGYLVDTLQALLRVPTDVPLGPQTLMEPDDPKLVHYVQQHLRPRLDGLGVGEVADVPANQLLVRHGTGDRDAPALLLMAYTPTQHHNLMADPFSGRIDVPPRRPSSARAPGGRGRARTRSTTPPCWPC